MARTFQTCAFGGFIPSIRQPTLAREEREARWNCFHDALCHARYCAGLAMKKFYPTKVTMYMHWSSTFQLYMIRRMFSTSCPVTCSYCWRFPCDSRERSVDIFIIIRIAQNVLMFSCIEIFCLVVLQCERTNSSSWSRKLSVEHPCFRRVRVSCFCVVDFRILTKGKSRSVLKCPTQLHQQRSVDFLNQATVVPKALTNDFTKFFDVIFVLCAHVRFIVQNSFLVGNGHLWSSWQHVRSSLYWV